METKKELEVVKTIEEVTEELDLDIDAKGFSFGVVFESLPAKVQVQKMRKFCYAFNDAARKIQEERDDLIKLLEIKEKEINQKNLMITQLNNGMQQIVTENNIVNNELSGKIRKLQEIGRERGVQIEELKKKIVELNGSIS